MHDTAYLVGGRAISAYWRPSYASLLDVGAMNVNGTLRDFAPPGAEYVGIDLSPGPSVDIVIDDPHHLPFEDGRFDMVVSSSCFEHDSMFWLTFLEICRVVKDGGVIYINAPSNGAFHRYPVDCWRFYPDSGAALVQWAQKNGIGLQLVESFVCGRKADMYNDCVMVFAKGDVGSQSIHRQLGLPVWNIHEAGEAKVASLNPASEDMMLLGAERRRTAELSEGYQRLVNRIARSRAPADHKSICSVCGGTEFVNQDVLHPNLIADWQLDTAEAAYMRRQQGTRCLRCGANLRSSVLARAISSFLGRLDPLLAVAQNAPDQSRILEINEAGTLSPVLRLFPNHQFASYPEVDIMALPYEERSFDAVIHSDTLEHVPDPVRALAECHRVLRGAGACIFTVPIIVGRLSRNRQGLTPSYHGNYQGQADDYIVHTEFGADAWGYAAQAGFARITMDVLDYPTAVAITAWKEAN